MHSTLPRRELWSGPGTRDHDHYQPYYRPVATLHLFFLLAARAGVFVSHSAARQKRLYGRQERTTTGTGRSHERQARPVTNLYCGFGAQTAPAKGGPERLYAEGTAGNGGSGKKARVALTEGLALSGFGMTDGKRYMTGDSAS